LRRALAGGRCLAVDWYHQCSVVKSFSEQLWRARCGGEGTIKFIPSAAAAQFSRALWEAGFPRGGRLAPEGQQHLFEEVVKSHGESIRSQLAIFLHDKHPLTSDPFGEPREMIEPDSLGG